MVHKSDDDRRRSSMREPDTYVSVDNEKMPLHRRELNNLKKQTSDPRPTKRMLWEAIVDYRKNPLIKTMQATDHKANTDERLRILEEANSSNAAVGSHRIESNSTEQNWTELKTEDTKAKQVNLKQVNSKQWRQRRRRRASASTAE